LKELFIVLRWAIVLFMVFHSIDFFSPQSLRKMEFLTGLVELSDNRINAA